MRGFLCAYCVGIVLLVKVPSLQAGWWIAGLLLGGLFALCVVTGYCTRCNAQAKLPARIRQAGTLGAAVLAGCVWHLVWATHGLAARLPAALEGQDMWVTGHVADLPSRNERATQFQFYIESSESLPGDRPFEKRLILLNSYQSAEYSPGQRWHLLVRLNRPHGFANAGGFDYEAYLLQQGIAAKGYVRNHPDNALLTVEGNTLQRMRFRVRQRLHSMADQLPTVGILSALVLGDRSQLSPADWELMSATGTNHLFVISGLHIGLIAAVMYWTGCAVLRLCPPLSLYWPRQKMALVLALFAALAYSLLAGFTLPTQRAFVMTAVFVLGQLGSRSVPVSFRFLMALAIVLTLNPLAPLSPGFWLSFGAVAALLLWLDSGKRVSPDGSRAQSLTTLWLRPQLVVFIGLAPFLMLWTQQVTVLSPLINVVAIPIVGLIIVPLALLGAGLLSLLPSVAALVLHLADFVLQHLMTLLSASAAYLGWSVVVLSGLSLVAIMSMLIASVLLLAPLPAQWRLLALPLSLPVLLPIIEAPPHGAADIHVLDVGQGLSVVVRTANHVLVYDTGAAMSPEFDLGTAVVVPALRQAGIKSVDAVVVSHFDNDHAGGLRGLLGQVPILQMLSSHGKLAAQAIRGAGRVPTKSPLVPELVSRSCAAGQQWQWDGVVIEVLHPLSATGFVAADRLTNGSVSSQDNDNNVSCVVQVTAGEHRLLLPGDIERQAERALSVRLGSKLQSAILLAPHHGSNTSSTYGFIKHVAPRYVVYTSGYRNSFGHPTDNVQKRYDELGSTGFVTHNTGMLTFRLQAGQPLQPPMPFRHQQPRYWY